MKIVMVTLKVVDDDEVRAIKKTAKQEGRLPILGVVTDDTGPSHWIGEEFLSFATEHALDGKLPNNHIYFVMDN